MYAGAYGGQKSGLKILLLLWELLQLIAFKKPAHYGCALM